MRSGKFCKFLLLAVLFALAVSGLYLLWGGRGGNVSYVDMACGFEGRSLDCMDSIPAWKQGLAYYDSSLEASHDTLGSLKNLLWEYWGLEFAGAGEASVARESILPLQVLDSKKSGCMGLSWLALMVAESRGIDLHAILLPGHVFLRYGGNAGSVNLEPNRQGYSYSDDEYREKYKDGRWTGLEFRPLKSAQFVGLAAFDLGNLFLKNDPSGALKWYRVAEDLFPEFPGISANQKVAKNILQ